MNKNLFTLTVIYNLCVLLCFAGLALFFNKWWIIFFAILFIENYKHKDKTNDDDTTDDEGVDGDG
jgi:predicted secreted protein